MNWTDHFAMRMVIPLLGIAVLPFVHRGIAQEPKASSAPPVRQARVLLARHQTDAAARVLSSYLATHGDDADALTVLAQVRLEQNDAAEAKDLLTRALASSPNSPAANVALGNVMLAEHRDPEAMDRFETVLAIDLRDKEARQGELAAVTELAISARRNGSPDAALRALEHARTKMPDDPKLLLDLGIQEMDVDLLPKARESLNLARKLDPKNPDTIYALARVETEEQHMQAAEIDLRAYLAKRPEDASAHFGLGRVLEIEQRTAEAKIEFERSIQLQPVQTESYYELGQMELEVHHDAQATPRFTKVLERDATHGGALTGMGIVAFRAKNYAEAEQYLARAEKTAPNYQPAHYYRGLALARLGQKEESQRELQAASELDRQQEGPQTAADAVPSSEMSNARPQ
jgi:tetratricopeptide (TPR) repeat protein